MYRHVCAYVNSTLSLFFTHDYAQWKVFLEWHQSMDAAGEIYMCIIFQGLPKLVVCDPGRQMTWSFQTNSHAIMQPEFKLRSALFTMKIRWDHRWDWPSTFINVRKLWNGKWGGSCWMIMFACKGGGDRDRRKPPIGDSTCSRTAEQAPMKHT